MSGSSWRPGLRGAVCTVLSCALALAAASVGASSSSSSATSCDEFVCNLYDLLPSTFTGCYGDVDGNGFVNAGDRGQVQANQGRTDALSVCLYDLDGNGVINAGDRGYVSANIGHCRTMPEHQGRGCTDNQPPSVSWDGGNELTVSYGEAVTLSPTITDPDASTTPLQLSWRLESPTGTALNLGDQVNASASLSFTFVQGVHAPGDYLVQLCVSDGCRTVQARATLTLVEASSGGEDGGEGSTGGEGDGSGGEEEDPDPAGLDTACEDLAAAFGLAGAQSPEDFGTVAEGTTFNLAAADYVPNAPAGTTFTWLVRRCVDAAGAPVACDSAAASSTLAPNCSYLGGEDDLNSTGQSYSAPSASNDGGATATLTVDRTGPQDIILLASHPGCGEQSAAVARVNAYVQGPLAAGIKVYRLSGSGREGCSGRWEEVDPATTTFEVGERIKFSASPSRGSIVGWSWQFMDTTGGGGEEVVKAYEAAGNYDVQLTVYRQNWQSARATLGVSIISGPQWIANTDIPQNGFNPVGAMSGASRLWSVSTAGNFGHIEPSTVLNSNPALQLYGPDCGDGPAADCPPPSNALQMHADAGIVALANEYDGFSVYSIGTQAGQEESIHAVASRSVAEIRSDLAGSGGSVTAPVFSAIVGVAVGDGRVYLATDGECYVLAYDLGAAGELVMQSSVHLPRATGRTLRKVGDAALVVRNQIDGTAYVVDIRDSASLTVVEELELGRSMSNKLAVFENRVAFLNEEGIVFFDVQVADSGELTTHQVGPAVQAAYASVFCFNDRHLFAIGAGAEKFDISDPENPYVMSQIPGVYGLTGASFIWEIGVSSGEAAQYVLVGVSGGGFAVLSAGAH